MAGTATSLSGVAVEIDVPNKNTIVGHDEQERREMKNDHYAVVNRAFAAAFKITTHHTHSNAIAVHCLRHLSMR